MAQLGFRCKLCTAIVAENELLKHIIERHTPTELFDLIFLTGWGVKMKKEKKE